MYQIWFKNAIGILKISYENESNLRVQLKQQQEFSIF